MFTLFKIARDHKREPFILHTIMTFLNENCHKRRRCSISNLYDSVWLTVLLTASWFPNDPPFCFISSNPFFPRLVLFAKNIHSLFVQYVSFQKLNEIIRFIKITSYNKYIYMRIRTSLGNSRGKTQCYCEIILPKNFGC